MLLGLQQVREPSKSGGFTLVELLTSIAVMGLLFSLAVPALGGILAKWQRDSATRAVIDHLQLARAMAIRSSRRVAMCNSEDGAQCAGRSSKDWSQGWLVYRDENANKRFDEGDTLIASAGPRSGISSLQSSNGIRQFVFLPSGLMASGMSTLVVTPETGKPMRIIVNRVGRLRLSEGTDQQ